MPAPTAVQKPPQIQAQPVIEDASADNDMILIDTAAPSLETNGVNPDKQVDAVMEIDEEGRPRFAPAQQQKGVVQQESRKVPIPPHRMTPLKAAWPKMFPPLVEHLLLQVRMNLKDKAVELRTSKKTTDTGALQKGADFVKAFSLGFDVDDAIALLRLDDLYIETFEIKDVKTLTGEHLARAIGRIAGKDGKTKYAIENTTKTRIVLADQKIHILGGFQNIRMARTSVVNLILGSPPGKVYGNLRTVAARQKERF
ncbi:pre-rRNA-processing protein PNO1 [Sphaerosporella brunnea]|uniref:Pre-rRNA-processing protein PNO1 n=1 Tax=Sphaerosporella brunnea TaxID=1250544 RepID=A0A5J5EY23_9PEZI|nr:pre-rRNA-processing protein PNO1 [Sphaerosporella brunnea]